MYYVYGDDRDESIGSDSSSDEEETKATVRPILSSSSDSDDSKSESAGSESDDSDSESSSSESDSDDLEPDRADDAETWSSSESEDDTAGMTTTTRSSSFPTIPQDQDIYLNTVNRKVFAGSFEGPLPRSPLKEDLTNVNIPNLASRWSSRQAARKAAVAIAALSEPSSPPTPKRRRRAASAVTAATTTAATQSRQGKGKGKAVPHMLPTRSIPRGYERSREDNDELVFSSDSEDEARGTTMTTRSSSPLTSDEGEDFNMNTVYRGTSRQAARKASAAIAALSEASSPPKRRRRMAPVAAGAGADHSSTTPTLPSVDQARKGRGRAALPPPPSPPSRPSIRVAKRFREDSDEDSDDYEEHSTLKSVAKHRAAKKTRQPPPKKQRAKPWPSSYLNTLTCFRPDWEPTLEYECPLCHDKGPLLNQSSPSGQPADLTVHFGGHLAQMRSKTKAEQEAEKEVQETSEEMTEDEQDNAGDTQKTQKQPGLSTSGVLVDCPWPDCAEKNIPGARFAVHVRIVHYGVRWRCPTNCGWLSEASDRVRGHCNREHATDPMLEGLL